MKKLFIGCAGLMGLLMLVALISVAVMSPSYEIMRTRQVPGTPEAAYAIVADLHSWPDWTAWNAVKDPSCVWNWKGPSAVAGSTMSWKGDPDGNGEGRLTLTECLPGERVAYDVVFHDVNGGTTPAQGSITFTAVGEKTQVAWMMKGEVSGVAKLIKPIQLTLVGGAFDEGLKGLELQLQHK